MTQRNSSWWLLAWFLGGMLGGGCERAPEPAAQMPASTPESSPAAARTPSQPAPAQQQQPVPAEPSEGLTPVTGPSLLARVRSSPQRATLINVWASWCGNCRKELPMIMRVADDFAQYGLGLMLVSADEPDKRAEAAEFLARLAPGRPGFVVEGSLAPFKRTLHPTWKGSIPSTFLYDRAGVLRHTWLGPVYEHELTPVIQEFLGAAQ